MLSSISQIRSHSFYITPPRTQLVSLPPHALFLSVSVCSGSFSDAERHVYIARADVNWERAFLDGNFTVRALSLSTEKARRRDDKTHLSSLIKWFSDIKCLKGRERVADGSTWADRAEPLRCASHGNTHLTWIKGRLCFLYSDQGTSSRVEISSGALHMNSKWRTMQNFRRHCKPLVEKRN
jgi:hypothetical protein